MRKLFPGDIVGILGDDSKYRVATFQDPDGSIVIFTSSDGMITEMVDNLFIISDSTYPYYSDKLRLANIEVYIRKYRYRKDFGFKDGNNGYVEQMLDILGSKD